MILVMKDKFLEPDEIESDMWIWDAKLIKRKEPKQSIYPEMVSQPIGWRHVMFIDKPLFGSHKILFYETGWDYYQTNRFYKTQLEESED